jgi:hypothetical protein
MIYYSTEAKKTSVVVSLPRVEVRSTSTVTEILLLFFCVLYVNIGNDRFKLLIALR